MFSKVILLGFTELFSWLYLHFKITNDDNLILLQIVV